MGHLPLGKLVVGKFDGGKVPLPYRPLEAVVAHLRHFHAPALSHSPPSTLGHVSLTGDRGGGAVRGASLRPPSGHDSSR